MLCGECIFQEAVRAGWVMPPKFLQGRECVVVDPDAKIRCCARTAAAINPSKSSQVLLENLNNAQTSGDGHAVVALLTAIHKIETSSGKTLL